MHREVVILSNPYRTLKNKMNGMLAQRVARRLALLKEFYSVIEDVVNTDVVNEMRNYVHHAQLTCFDHSLHVAYWNYKVCSALGWDKVAAARAGMLHDLFLYDWHTYKIKKLSDLHGFKHPYSALENAKANFELSALEQDIIVKHMFPLTLALPRYKETLVIIMTDKMCCMSEVMGGWFKIKPYICRIDNIKDFEFEKKSAC